VKKVFWALFGLCFLLFFSGVVVSSIAGLDEFTPVIFNITAAAYCLFFLFTIGLSTWVFIYREPKHTDLSGERILAEDPRAKVSGLGTVEFWRYTILTDQRIALKNRGFFGQRYETLAPYNVMGQRGRVEWIRLGEGLLGPCVEIQLKDPLERRCKLYVSDPQAWIELIRQNYPRVLDDAPQD
jgi:hypothetical protein